MYYKMLNVYFERAIDAVDIEKSLKSLITRADRCKWLGIKQIPGPLHTNQYISGYSNLSSDFTVYGV